MIGLVFVFCFLFGWRFSKLIFGEFMEINFRKHQEDVFKLMQTIFTHKWIEYENDGFCSWKSDFGNTNHTGFFCQYWIFPSSKLLIDFFVKTISLANEYIMIRMVLFSKTILNYVLKIWFWKQFPNSNRFMSVSIVAVQRRVLLQEHQRISCQMNRHFRHYTLPLWLLTVFF